MKEVFRYVMPKKGVDARAVFKSPTMLVLKDATP